MTDDRVSILIVGDYAPCRGYDSLLASKGSLVFGDLKADIASSDIAILNLETPLCRQGEPIKKAGPLMKAHPTTIQAVAEAGFNVIGLANNHIMDYGPVCLRETIAACKNLSIDTCGTGSNIEDSQIPLFIERKGLKIALIAVAEREFSIADVNFPGAAPLGAVENFYQIQFAKKNADLVLMSVHGGNEYYPYPRPGLRQLCRYFIDLGVDGIVCHHSHVPGAYELYKNKFISYGVGNFIFDHHTPPLDWNIGYAVKLEFCVRDKLLVASAILPFSQSVAQGGLIKLKGDDYYEFEARLQNYNEVIVDDEAFKNKWIEFSKARRANVLLTHFSPFLFRGMGKLARFSTFQKLLLPKSSRLRREGSLICPSHYELLLSVIKGDDNV